METLLLALALFLQNGLPVGPQARAASVNVVGAWEGGLLPPGISPFETIRSTVTFRADGTYTLRVVKPTGEFGGSGTYRVEGNTLTLGALSGSAAEECFRASRRGPTLTLEPDADGTKLLTLSPAEGRAR